MNEITNQNQMDSGNEESVINAGQSEEKHISVGNKALQDIRDSLKQAEPKSDIERREQMQPDFANVEKLKAKGSEYISDDHTDVDPEVPPEGVGKPYHDGTTKTIPTELLEQGYDKEVDWLIKFYIPACSFGMIYGASESFKSFHAVGLGACVATGRAWNGVECMRSCVLYIAAEGGVGASKRAQGWKQVYNDGGTLERLHAIKMPVYLGSPQCVSEIINTIIGINDRHEENVSVVFIDTLARCFGGSDENRTPDMNLFIAGCDKIRAETGVTVVVIHHTGKNKEKDARGSSALRAACDFEYLIDRPEKQMFYTLKCTKLKDAEYPKTQAFDMSSHFLKRDKDGDEITTLVPSMQGRELPDEESGNSITLSQNHEALCQAVRSRMAAGAPTTIQLIRDDLKAQGFNIGNFSRWLDAVLSKGVLKKKGDELILINKGA